MDSLQLRIQRPLLESGGSVISSLRKICPLQCSLSTVQVSGHHSVVEINSKQHYGVKKWHQLLCSLVGWTDYSMTADVYSVGEAGLRVGRNVAFEALWPSAPHPRLERRSHSRLHCRLSSHLANEVIMTPVLAGSQAVSTTELSSPRSALSLAGRYLAPSSIAGLRFCHRHSFSDLGILGHVQVDG